MKYNKNETCGNLLLNKNLKGKACRSYDGEVMPFLKLPPHNSCVTSKAKVHCIMQMHGIKSAYYIMVLGVLMTY